MSMSQSFHQGVYNFSNGYEKPPKVKQGGDWPISQRDLLRMQGLELQQQVEVDSGEPQVYHDTGGGMLTEMVDFPLGSKSANDHNMILDSQIQSSYRLWQKQHLPIAVNEAGLLFMNHHVKDLSSPTSTNSLNMSIPNSSNADHLQLQGYHFLDYPSQFPWIKGSSNEVDDSAKIGKTIEGQGLSLSLSSSLSNLEVSKFQDLRTGDGGMYFPDQNTLCNVSDYAGQVNVGLSGSPRIENVLRNSRYLRAGQELLEEFCYVGKGCFKSPKTGNPSTICIVEGSVGEQVSSASSKDRPPLSASGKTEYQRKKVNLLSMLDEVDARYNRYCEQMQAIVNSFDYVIGYGAAAPYTNLAQKEMSRHFRRIKDAILAQLKVTCEILGEKDIEGTIGLTKGETPGLRLLEHKFRQQKAIHQLGMLNPETWRPQRGLPERSVNRLRAWLFEHFLHPYPSDADKHLLSRQTGLSKNQISNWFINARVRLWKPMVEDIYKEEIKEEETTINSAEDHLINQNIVSATTTSSSSSSSTTLVGGRRSEINATEKDPSKNIINYGRYTLGNQAILQGNPVFDHDDQTVFGCFTANFEAGMRGIASTSQAGDVSLTLGLRQPSSNLSKKSEFSRTEFGAV